MTIKERDPYLCAAGSFFFPGLGQVYCGRIMRGIIFLIPAVLLTIPYSVGSLILYWPSYDFDLWRNLVYGLNPLITQIVDLVVRVIATYDAYKVAKSSGTS